MPNPRHSYYDLTNEELFAEVRQLMALAEAQAKDRTIRSGTFKGTLSVIDFALGIIATREEALRG